MIRDVRENYPQLGMLNIYIENIEGFIAGGCFRSVFEGGVPKDVDVFFRNSGDFVRAVEFYEKRGKWKKIYENESATGFYRKDFWRVDLVRSVFGTPEEVLNLFDFSIAKFAMDKDGGIIYADTYWRDLYLKRLVCDSGIPKPAGTFNRTQKYAAYGYFMCRETKLKLIEAIRYAADRDIALDKSLYRGWD
jgi:hypothetical protein